MFGGQSFALAGRVNLADLTKKDSSDEDEKELRPPVDLNKLSNADKEKLK